MSRMGFETMTLCFTLGLSLAGCGDGKGDPKAEAPPAVKVEHEEDVNVVRADHAEQFPLAAAAVDASTAQLSATGTVSPDISSTVPVISISTVRVGDMHP